MSQAWTVSLEVVAPVLEGEGLDEVRTEEIAATAGSRATAGAKAVAQAKGYGWKVLSILDIRPNEDSIPSSAKLLSFPPPSTKPN